KSAAHTEYRYTYEVEQAIKQSAQYGDSSVNIQDFADRANSDFRKNEAFAELVSMNSVASRVAKTEGSFNLESFLKRADPGTECIDDRKLDREFHLTKNGFQLTGGKINSQAIETVAVCHFDRGAETLGLKGTS